MKKFKLLQILSLVGLLFTGACSDYLERKSQDEVIVTTVSDFSEFLLGSGYLTGIQYEMLYLMDDDTEIYASPRSPETYMALEKFGTFTWQPDMYERERKLYDDGYTETYGRLMGVNAVLDGIDEASGETEARDQVKAEALALRGYYYFMLVNLFGEPYNFNKEAAGVPLKLTVGINENGIPRNTVEEVYTQIVKDLTASSDVFEKYPKRRGNYRINLSAVNILLSRVYLYMEQWDSVIVRSNKAIQYAEGLTDYTKNTSARMIMPSYDHSEVEWVYGMITLQSFGPSADLLSKYDPADCRPGFWFNIYDYSFPLLKKDYDWSQSATPVNTMRISEAYLNRAEAYAQQKNIAGALADLNELRRNRITGYSDVNTSDPSLLLEEVRLERRLELCFDEHRWFDLRRYGMPSISHRYQYKKSDPLTIYTLKEKDPMYTLPFPNSALKNNTRLEQNPSAYEPNRSGAEVAN